MADSADQRVEILRQLKSIGASLNELSRQSGLHKTTVLRALSENPRHAPSTRTLDTLLRTVQKMALQSSAEGISKLTEAMPVLADESSEPQEEIDDLPSQMRTMLSAILSIAIDNICAKLDLSADAGRRLGAELVSPDLRLAIARGVGLFDERIVAEVRELVGVFGLVMSAGDSTAQQTAFAAGMERLTGGRILTDPWATFMHRCALVIAEMTKDGEAAAWMEKTTRPPASTA